MTGSALANFFINKSQKDGVPITNLKLQKLMFIGYGWVTALTSPKLIGEEKFQAWQNGPVLPSIYHQMKRFGGNDLKEYAVEYYIEEDLVYIPKIKENEILGILDKIWGIYMKFTSKDLIDLISQDDAPWMNTIKNHTHNSKEISNESIEKYYFNYIKEIIG